MRIEMMIYLIYVLGGFSILLWAAVMLLTIILGYTLIAQSDHADKDYGTPIKKVIVAISVILFVQVLIPSEKFMWAIVGVHAIKEVGQSELSTTVIKAIEKNLNTTLQADSK